MRSLGHVGPSPGVSEPSESRIERFSWKAQNMTLTPQSGARYAVEKGYGRGVFPIQPNSKLPIPGVSWDGLVGQHVPAEPMDNNWAIATGAGLLVVDIDAHNDGLTSWDRLKAQHGPIPETFAVSTPNGGFHLYFRGDGPCSASKIAPGIDTRGAGGYVVCPGSALPTGSYDIAHDCPPAPLPAWVSQALIDAKTETPKNPAGEIELSEGERNSMLYREGCALRDRGYGEDAIYAALQALNDNHSDGALDEDELRTLSRQASKHPPGQARQAAEFRPVPKENSPIKLLKTLDFEAIPRAKWLIEGYLAPGYITAIGAPGNYGKTRIGALTDIAVASGQSIMGWDVCKGMSTGVLAITEDPMDDMYRRAAGVCVAHGIDHRGLDIHLWSMLDDPMCLIKKDGSKYIRNEAQIRGLIDYITAHKIGLLRLDPYSSIHALNENDSTDAVQLTLVLKEIMSATGCAVLLMCHVTKSSMPQRNAKDRSDYRGNMHVLRGSSALVDACRVVYTLDRYHPKADEEYGVPLEQSYRWLRMDVAKGNTFKQDEQKQFWYYLESPALPSGEEVGAAKVATPPQAVACELDQEGAIVAKVADLMEANGVTEGQAIPVTQLAEIAKVHPNWKDVFGKGKFFKEDHKLTSMRVKLQGLFSTAPERDGYRYWISQTHPKGVRREVV